MAFIIFSFACQYVYKNKNQIHFITMFERKLRKSNHKCNCQIAGETTLWKALSHYERSSSNFCLWNIFFHQKWFRFKNWRYRNKITGKYGLQWMMLTCETSLTLEFCSLRCVICKFDVTTLFFIDYKLTWEMRGIYIDCTACFLSTVFTQKLWAPMRATKETFAD